MKKSGVITLLLVLIASNVFSQDGDYFRGQDPRLISRYNEALKMLAGGNPEKGMKEMKKLSDKNRDFYEAHLAAGFHLKERRQFEEAVTFFSRAIELRPEAALPYFYRGDCFLSQKKFLLAGRDYGLCIRYDSLFYAAYNNLAVVHILNQGKGKLLESELRVAKTKIKALEKRQDIMDPVMLMNTGLIHLHLFEFKEAIPYFDRYLGISDSLDGRARFNKALCHYYLKEYVQAKRNFLIARVAGHRKEDCEEFISFLGYIEEQLRKTEKE